MNGPKKPPMLPTELIGAMPVAALEAWERRGHAGIRARAVADIKMIY
jgi:hypothetical protein